jgi:hypothetical protein
MARHNLSSAFSHGLRRLLRGAPSRHSRRELGRKAPPARPRLEALEDRVTPTTFTTTTLADDGTAASLRGAILRASDDAGTAADTVQLQAGTYQLTIGNAAAKHEQANAQGDLNITSPAHALVIQGTTDANGHPTTVIQQMALDRVFQVVNPGTSVTFKDLVIEGGQAQDDGSAGAEAGSTQAFGGGILDDGGDVTLTNVVLQNNSADAGAGFDASGGGIYAEVGGSLTIQSSVVQANGAFGGANNNIGGFGGFAEGGGVFASGTTTIIASILSGNTVTGGAADKLAGGPAEGGGIYTEGATTTITDSTLSGNTLRGGRSSGGVGGSARGGGLLVTDGGTVVITASVLSGNTLIGSNGNLSNNLSFDRDDGGEAEGGGIFVHDQATAVITASVLSGNILTGGNGSINGSNAHIGGDVGGHAQGGGVYGDSGSTLILSTSVLSDNRLTGGNGNFVSGTVGGDAEGGGIYAVGSTATLTASTLSGNIVTGGNASGGRAYPGTAQGGGAYFVGDTNSKLDNSTVAGNQAIGGLSASGSTQVTGGGLFFGDKATATLTNVTVANNKASRPQGVVGETEGGGILNDSGAVTLVNTLVALNSATSGPDFDGTAGAGSGHNLIGDATGSSGFGASHGDLVGTTASPLDPRLGPLQDNGGPTPTMALLPGSPAVNAGDNSAQSVVGSLDQRGQGFARVVNGVIDIGAFEAQPPPPPGDSSPAPKPPPALHTPPLLALFDALLHGIEAVNGNGTETVTDSLFGIPLLLSTYDGSGDLMSVTLFGINVTALFEL